MINSLTTVKIPTTNSFKFILNPTIITTTKEKIGNTLMCEKIISHYDFCFILQIKNSTFVLVYYIYHV